MTNSSEERTHAAACLRRLFGELQGISQQPVTEVGSETPLEPLADDRRTLGVDDVHSALASLMKRLYAGDPNCPRTIARDDALARGLAALRALPSVGGSDSYLARLDWALQQGREGLRDVLGEVVLFYEGDTQRKQGEWTMVTAIGLLDWETRVEMATLLQEKLAPFLDPVRDVDPAELVDCIAALVDTWMAASEELQSWGGPRTPWSP